MNATKLLSKALYGDPDKGEYSEHMLLDAANQINAMRETLLRRGAQEEEYVSEINRLKSVIAERNIIKELDRLSGIH